MSLDSGIFEPGDVVVVEQLQTGEIVSFDQSTELIEWRHDGDGQVYASPWWLARHLVPGEPRLVRQ